METSIAKRNFPSCSLRSQFTASQKLPLLFPNAKHMESATGTSKWEPSNRKKKLPLLLTSFAIHCLTKASAFVPQCKTYGISNWKPRSALVPSMLQAINHLKSNPLPTYEISNLKP